MTNGAPVCRIHGRPMKRFDNTWKCTAPLLSEDGEPLYQTDDNGDYIKDADGGYKKQFCQERVNLPRQAPKQAPRPPQKPQGAPQAAPSAPPGSPRLQAGIEALRAAVELHRGQQGVPAEIVVAYAAHFYHNFLKPCFMGEPPAPPVEPGEVPF